MKLAKEGYGTIEQIQQLDIKTFLNLIHYEEYLDKYAKAFRILNEKRAP